MSERSRGATYGLAAALLFGASAPLCKLLLPSIRPLMLAGLLYLGAGVGLSAYRWIARRGFVQQQAQLARSDSPLLGGVIVLGGIIGPVLMLFGLQQVSGVAGALLLNLEAVFTMLIALLLFREHLGRAEAVAAAAVVLGAGVLGYRPGEMQADWKGVLAIAGACLSWGFDNNLTQRLSRRDPTAVVRVKTLGAGTCTFLMALAMKQQLPRPGLLMAALLVGALVYGISIVFDVYALRYLGAAREAAFFAVAPFAGAALAVPLLRELPSTIDYLAAVFMAAGVALLVRARHSHAHRHEALVHEHEHLHDEHHQHNHEGPVTEPHSHVHRHGAVEHEHPHVSDLHHRHPHK